MVFLVKGVRSATGQAMEERIEAATADGAKQIAGERGIEVAEIVVIGEPALLPVLDYQSPMTDPLTTKMRLKIILAMLFAEILAVAGFVAWIFWNTGSSDGLRGLSVIAALAFLIIQMGILAPVARPRVGSGPGKSPWYWLSAIALGLMLGFVVVSALFLAADFYWAMHQEFTDSERNTAAVVALFVAAVSWLISIPLIMAFMKRRHPDTVLARLAAALFLGSAIEFVASIPIMDLARRRESCYCANASFWAILFSTMAGLIVLGPMVLLVIVARHTRAASRGLCPVCGQDLRPLPNRDRCSRCGTGWKAPPA